MITSEIYWTTFSIVEIVPCHSMQWKMIIVGETFMLWEKKIVDLSFCDVLSKFKYIKGYLYFRGCSLWKHCRKFLLNDLWKQIMYTIQYIPRITTYVNLDIYLWKRVFNAIYCWTRFFKITGKSIFISDCYVRSAFDQSKIFGI